MRCDGFEIPFIKIFIFILIDVVQDFIAGEDIFYCIIFCREDEFHSRRVYLKISFIVIYSFEHSSPWILAIFSWNKKPPRSLESMIVIVFLGDELELLHDACSVAV